MKPSLAPLMKSEKQDWATPWAVVRALEQLYGSFELDVCATFETAKAPFWLGQYCGDDFVDGLNCEWTVPVGDCGLKGAVAWMNPPYNDCASWIKKAYEESQKGATVVCLIPARTDTRYWHDYVMKASEILLVKGRIRFEGAAASAPFPSAVVVFRPGDNVPVFKSWSVPK